MNHETHATVGNWKHSTIYLDGDQVFGQWSDTASVAVTR